MNSIRNKFELLSQYCQNNLDILLISQTKLDSSFPRGQFQLNGYCTPYRLDRNVHGGRSFIIHKRSYTSPKF